MVKIDILNSLHDLGRDPNPYFMLFQDIGGNFFMPLLGYIKLSEMHKYQAKEILVRYEKCALKNQKRLVNIMEGIEGESIGVIEIMRIEKTEGKLYDLVFRIYQMTKEYNWCDKDDFNSFYVEYNSILGELKKMKSK